MIELANEGEIRIVERSAIEEQQSTGWRVIGMTTEDVIEQHRQEVVCSVGANNNNNNTCKHGNYGGACSITDFVDIPMKVQRPLVIMTRDEDSINAELGSLKARHRQVYADCSAKKNELDACLKENKEIKKELEESERMRVALTADLAEHEVVNEKVNKERRIVMDENMKLRTEVHSFTMGRVVRASELACTGEPMHPLAFAYLLDSLDRITADPPAYVALLADLVDKRIIKAQTDKDGNVSVVVTDNEKFRSALRVLDSQTRLGGIDEPEVTF